MKVTQDQILRELTKLDLCQSAARHSNDELTIISERWFEIINKEFISADVFKRAVLDFQQNSEWFPSVKEILECVKTVWESYQRQVKRLPDNTDKSISFQEFKKLQPEYAKKLEKLVPALVRKK